MAIAVPDNCVDNTELDILDVAEREAFVKKVGIGSRRVAPAGLCASDLCMAATERIMSLKGYKYSDFGALVFVTQTPDYLLPGNCAIVQSRLGLAHSTFMLDINQGCAGYVYGLATLTSVMKSTGIEKGLLLVGDTITRLLSETDKSTVPIFSDAGSATVLEQTDNGGMMHFNLGADGQGAEVIRVAAGGARNPIRSIKEENRSSSCLSMKGIDVLNYSFRYVKPNIEALFTQAGWDMGSVDYFIFHQANKILNDSLLRKLGIPPEKAPETLGDFGNTSCATIPMTINHKIGKQLETESLRLMLSGFGVGFSWGSALINMGPVHCPELLEINTPYV